MLNPGDGRFAALEVVVGLDIGLRRPAVALIDKPLTTNLEKHIQVVRDVVVFGTMGTLW